MQASAGIPWAGGVLSANRHGIFHLRGLGAEDWRPIIACESKPPVFPIFMPKFEHDEEHGEGMLITEYSFARGRAYWGQFGAAGVALRRQRSSVEYEYLLGRRSNVSSGNGRWAFFGGAHDSAEFAADPWQTAAKELSEEAGLLAAQVRQVVGRLTYDRDPHWRYDTFVAELEPELGSSVQITLNWEHSDADWFTADELLGMAEREELFAPVARDLRQLLAVADKG